MGKITFITGGARSGKSSLALLGAAAHGKRRAFIATMRPLDDELKERVQRHRQERGDGWQTFEEPLDVAELLRSIDGRFDVVVLDCLTLWLCNVMLGGGDAEEETGKLVSALREMKTPVHVVSNELGMGVVPDNSLAREFRDAAGRLNQAVAGEASEVYLTVSGIPLRIKPESKDG